MTDLRDYIEDFADRKFAYGEWDCIQFVLQWLRWLAGDEASVLTQAIFKFLRESGYWDKVKDEASYKDYIAQIHVHSQRDLFHLFNRRGFIEAKKPQPGDIIIAPSQALGILGNDHRGLFLRPTEGVVSVPVPKGSKFLSCHL